MTPATIGIGDFAKATHLTIKTLRHYHRIGLLEPAEVDESTGYRRYGTDQIPQALIISRFRKLDMPLDTIHEVLAAPDLATRNAVIAAHLERLEAALEHTRSAAESLRDLLGRAEPLPTTIEHLAVPTTPAAAITATIADDDDTILWVLGALSELRGTLAVQDIPVTGQAGGIYADELFTQARGEATVFLPCAGEIRPAGRVKSVIVPEAELATIVHAGPHTNLDRSYGALAAYVAEHALAVPGPIREYYLTDLADTSDQEGWRTRIGWPIFQITP
jgi:DNA-binding transcriptional MerR regulator/effector-binding domain-containing protein